MDPPRILVGHIPNVGLGNQLIAIVGYLAHALLSRRVLFLQTVSKEGKRHTREDLACSDGRDGIPCQSSPCSTTLCSRFPYTLAGCSAV